MELKDHATNDNSEKGACTLIASRYVIEEARRNLAESDQPRMLDEYLAEIEVVSEADPDLSCPIALPEKDVPVLTAAICAGADYLLTGDLKHFGMHVGETVMGVPVLMPRDYLLPRIQPL